MGAAESTDRINPSISTIPDRKRKHLEVCLDRQANIETGNSRLSEICFPHRSLPETDARDISLETRFLGQRLALPLMISCMTGGSDEGLELNRILAKAAGKHSLAIGTGSIRVMLRHPETKSHFDLKSFAPDSPVLANIGAAQLVEYPPLVLLEAVKSIGADGLYVHLNPAQELFQTDGDRDFRGWYTGLQRLLDASDLPILVKETGAGIPPVEGLKLLKMGVSYVDLAGTGGTDWVAVEKQRSENSTRVNPDFNNAESLSANTFDTDTYGANSFYSWGYPTAELLLAYRSISRAGGESGRLVSDRIIASGGLRTPHDFALALGCGAWISAAALPFIRAASEGGIDAVSKFIESICEGLIAAITLCGARNLDGLRRTPLRIQPELKVASEELAAEALSSEALEISREEIRP